MGQTKENLDTFWLRRFRMWWFSLWRFCSLDWHLRSGWICRCRRKRWCGRCGIERCSRCGRSRRRCQTALGRWVRISLRASFFDQDLARQCFNGDFSGFPVDYENAFFRIGIFDPATKILIRWRQESFKCNKVVGRWAKKSILPYLSC